MTSRFVNIWFQIKQMSSFQPLEVVDRSSETQPQVAGNLNEFLSSIRVKGHWTLYHSQIHIKVINQDY